MPYINTAVTVSLVCWDTVNNVGKTGDASNITLRGVRDGTLFTPSDPSITQVDSTNLPGVYKASLTASENNGTFLTLGGKSSSTGCVIIPVSWSNELTGDAFARLGAPAGASVSADIAAVKSDTGATLTDTNELQTDLANGGRLDLLIDAIKAKTDNLPASPAAVGSPMTLTSAYDAAKSAASQTSVNSIPTNPLLINDVRLDNLDARISSRSTYAGGDTAGTTTLLSRISSALSFTSGNVHVHLKAKDNLDFGALEKASLNAATPSVTVSDKTGFSLATPPPTAAQIRSELDSNSAKLANLDTAVSSRLAADEYNDMADSIDLIVSGVADGVLSAIWGVDIDDLDTEGSIGQRLAAYFATTAEPAPDLSVSALKICNDALTLLGNSPITSLAENTKAARLCNQFYTSAVAATLRAYNWNCATARAELTADTEPPEFGFAIRYALPGDCLRVVAVSGNTHEWKIENGYILTNSAVVQIIYIKRISASEMDVMLSEAVAVKLASLIAFPLTNSATVAKAMFDLYKEKLADAHTMDAFENGTGEHLASDTWINARGQ